MKDLIQCFIRKTHFCKVLEFSIPGVWNVREVGAIDDSIRSIIAQRDCVLELEIISDRHCRIEPQGIVFFSQHPKRIEFVNAEMRYAYFEIGVALHYTFQLVGSAELIWVTTVCLTLWLPAHMRSRYKWAWKPR